MEARPVAVVVGAGVNGLSCAVRLLEAGWDVHVMSKERPEETVSLGAGAIWEYPPYKIEPQQQAKRWALASRDVFDALDAEATGVHQRRVHYLYRDAAAAPCSLEHPPWLRAVREYRANHVPPEVGPGFATGYSHVAPVVRMNVYLTWLERLALSMGCTFHWRALGRLDDALSLRPQVVVNCTGLGSVALVGDAAMTPVRGVLVLVHCPGVEHVFSDESSLGPALTYIVPKGGDVVACAGCAEPGATGLEVSSAEAAAVQARCAELLPALRGAPVLSAWAGLRPVRDSVRLEADALPGGVRVVHNYGHGGSGVVCSWGCAEEVVRMAGAPRALRPRDLGDQAAGLPPLLHQPRARL